MERQKNVRSQKRNNRSAVNLMEFRSLLHDSFRVFCQIIAGIMTKVTTNAKLESSFSQINTDESRQRSRLPSLCHSKS